MRWECMKVNSPSVPFVRFNCLNPGRLHPGHTSMIPPSVSVPTFNTVKSCNIRHPISHEWCSQAFSLGDTTSGRAARRQLQGRPHPSPSQSRVLGLLGVQNAPGFSASCHSRIFSGQDGSSAGPVSGTESAGISNMQGWSPDMSL